MKATRATIPGMVERREEFTNDSGTLRAIVNPEPVTDFGRLDDLEISRLRIDQDTQGLEYLVISYGTPVAWVTKTGFTYKVGQVISQTTTQHMRLLDGLT